MFSFENPEIYEWSQRTHPLWLDESVREVLLSSAFPNFRVWIWSVLYCRVSKFFILNSYNIFFHGNPLFPSLTSSIKSITTSSSMEPHSSLSDIIEKVYRMFYNGNWNSLKNELNGWVTISIFETEYPCSVAVAKGSNASMGFSTDDLNPVLSAFPSKYVIRGCKHFKVGFWCSIVRYAKILESPCKLWWC